jgi:hypothetical protein
MKTNNSLDETSKIISDIKTLNETQKEIINTYIENSNNYLGRLIEAQNTDSILGTFELLYVVANDSSVNYDTFIRCNEEGISQDRATQILRLICQRCSGEIKNEDLIYTQCEKLGSVLKDQELKSEIGKHFKNEIETYLTKKSSEIKKSRDLPFDPYETAQEDFLNQKLQKIQFEADIQKSEITNATNDNLPSGFPTPKSLDPLAKEEISKEK